MIIVHGASPIRQAVRAARAAGQRIGFVPTMGFLHEGHLSLVRRAARENDRVVASIFVNPLQFGPGEDLASYPRAPRRDHGLLRAEGVDWLFLPYPEQFYPAGFSTAVHVRGLDEQLCGRFRPGHFTGVATVVMKLLACCEPDRLYLGGKDYQQARVLARMTADLNLGVKVVICPTVREADGLAMSSRNSYLTPEQRQWAPTIHRALQATAGAIRRGSVRTAEAASQAMADRLQGGPGRLQYAELVDAESLLPRKPLGGEMVLAVACFLGRARLIDNVVVRLPDGPGANRAGSKRGPTVVSARRQDRKQGGASR